MTVDAIERLIATVSEPLMMKHLEEFSRRIKLSGTAEELESFNYLKACLNDFGYRTELILHDAYISLPGAARLDDGERDVECITHSFSRPSPPGGMRGPVVYAGRGTAEDFARLDVSGKIVLIESIASPAVSLRASQAGAIGQVHISPHEHLHEMCISAVWGNPASDQVARLPTTVVVGVRKADGDALRRRVRTGETSEITLSVDVDAGWLKTPILVADLAPALARSDESFVMFSGHHDTWHYGIMDNGGANAAMLEIARLLAGERDHWRRGLRLCFWSGHSQGRYSGSAWYADNHWAELERHCAVHVNIDSIGARGNTILADVPCATELLAVANEAVHAHANQELTGLRMSRAGDQSFWGIGIPAIFSWLGEQPKDAADNLLAGILGGANKQGAGFGWWWHTPDDTLDKIDTDLLMRDTRIYIHVIWRLLTDRVLPLDHAAQLGALVRELASLADHVGDQVDLDPVRNLAMGLQRRTAAISSKARDIRDDDQVARLNRALMRVSRALVPIDYTSGDRFTHDPALGQRPFPPLDPVRALAEAIPGSDDARFAAVAARQALNRISFAIDEADAALNPIGA